MAGAVGHFLHCSLQPVQTINFPGTGAMAFERKQNQQ